MAGSWGQTSSGCRGGTPGLGWGFGITEVGASLPPRFVLPLSSVCSIFGMGSSLSLNPFWGLWCPQTPKSSAQGCLHHGCSPPPKEDLGCRMSLDPNQGQRGCCSCPLSRMQHGWSHLQPCRRSFGLSRGQPAAAKPSSAFLRAMVPQWGCSPSTQDRGGEGRIDTPKPPPRAMGLGLQVGKLRHRVPRLLPALLCKVRVVLRAGTSRSGPRAAGSHHCHQMGHGSPGVPPIPSPNRQGHDVSQDNQLTTTPSMGPGYPPSSAHRGWICPLDVHLLVYPYRTP